MILFVKTIGKGSCGIEAQTNTEANLSKITDCNWTEI